MNTSLEPATRGARLAHELRSYALLSGYLFLCFLAFASFKAALLAEEGLTFAPLAFAAVKALIIAKFVMLGEMAPGLKRDGGGSLILATLRRSLGLLLLLAALLLAEHIIRALLAGAAARAELWQALARQRWEMPASLALIWLVLLPYVGLSHIAGRLDEAQWRRVLAGRD